MGRAGLVGDELGSALIGSRLVRDVMRLCFLMERQYAPYAKWFGTAFAQLESAAALTDVLLKAVQKADTWQERDRWLGEAYRVVAGRHNRLGLTEPMPERPIPVLWPAVPRDGIARFRGRAAAFCPGWGGGATG